MGAAGNGGIPGYERGFFSFTRVVILICSVLMVIGSLAAVAIGVYQETRKVNTNVSANTPTYQQFKDVVDASKKRDDAVKSENSALVEKQRAAERAQADLELEKRLQPYLSKIYSDLDLYARTVGQPTPSQDGIHNFITQQMAVISQRSAGKPELQWQYLDGMSQVCSELSSDASRLAKLPESDSARVEYADFITWYTHTNER